MDNSFNPFPLIIILQSMTILGIVCLSRKSYLAVLSFAKKWEKPSYALLGQLKEGCCRYSLQLLGAKSIGIALGCISNTD
jgi:hypothetical protein